MSPGFASIEEISFLRLALVALWRLANQRSHTKSKTPGKLIYLQDIAMADEYDGSRPVALWEDNCASEHSITHIKFW